MTDDFQARFNESADRCLDFIRTGMIIILCMMHWDGFKGWAIGAGLILGSIFVAGFIAAAITDRREKD